MLHRKSPRWRLGPIPHMVTWKIVPQPKAHALFPPFCVAPKRLPSLPWTSVAQGAAPFALSKLSSVLKVCAGKVTAAVANAKKRAHDLVYPFNLLIDSPHARTAARRAPPEDRGQRRRRAMGWGCS